VHEVDKKCKDAFPGLFVARIIPYPNLLECDTKTSTVPTFLWLITYYWRKHHRVFYSRPGF